MKRFLLFLAFFAASCTTYYPPENFDAISPGNVRTRPTGPTVRIRSIVNLDAGPVEMVLAEELSRGGYSLISDGEYSGRGFGFRASDWANYFPQSRRERRDGGCSVCDRVDYLVDVGARPVSSGRVSGAAGAGHYGYGVSALGDRVVNEVEIYIVFYDPSGRAVPGKSSRARVRVRRFGALAGDILTRALGVQASAREYTYDPWTEAAVRTIPKMIQTQ